MAIEWTDETHRYLHGGDIAESVPKCAHCGGMIAIRNPRGDCDHLCWPDNLTDEAKRANGYHPETVTVWKIKETAMHPTPFIIGSNSTAPVNLVWERVVIGTQVYYTPRLKQG